MTCGCSSCALPDECQYDVESATTSVQLCGRPTADGVYCAKHAVMVKAIATNPAFLEWWERNKRK
jgi:hypothetical protein